MTHNIHYISLLGVGKDRCTFIAALELPSGLPCAEGLPAVACYLLLVLAFSVLVANSKKILYTVANPARGLLNRKKKKKSGIAPPTHPSPHAARSKKIKQKLRDVSIFLGAAQVSVRLASVQGFPRLFG